MKGKKSVIITGIGIMIMGMIFHLQGQSIVGPESSFMYSNPQWVTYGIQIVIAGGVILAIGISLSFIKRN
jgi:preprotein translocase subunit Sss1